MKTEVFAAIGLTALAVGCVTTLDAAAAAATAEKVVLAGAEAIAKFPANLRDSEAAKLEDARWCELLPGVEYYYGKFSKLYNKGKEDVSVIRVDYRKAKVRMKFVDNRVNGGGNQKTSAVAGKYKALFGINCTFPQWYSKMEGKVVVETHKEGGLAMNDDKTYEFFNSSWWKTHPNAEGYADVFATEALGLLNGKQTLGGTGWGAAPYTFMGEATNNVLYICVVDGRTPRSQGMGYGTVHTFLREFGCFNGMCIDGGGSTTMVIRKDLLPADVNELQHTSEGSPDHWTMNHTIDNILGRERKVCNQLLFVADSGVDVTAFGARAGGEVRENTAAIQRAIDQVAKAGGGRVTVPKGTFETGTVYLRSGVELHLAEGAVLKGTTDLSLYNADDVYPQNTGRVVPEEWSGGHLVYAVGEKNVAITGPGVLDGNGPAFFGDVDTCYWPWYRHGLKLHPTDRGRYRPGPEIAIVECEGVRIENLTFTNSATWTCLLHGSSDIVVRNFRSINDWTIANSDGLSIDCCRNVLVENATIRTGDDGIAIRASGRRLLKPQACENVLVTNCTISSCCYGIRFGVGNGDIRNVRVVGCTFPETACGLGFTCAWINAARNVFIEDVRVADCRFDDAVNALEFSSASDGSPSRIAGISFDRCTFSSVLGGISVRGGKNEAYNPKDIAFRDCTFTVQPDFKCRGEAYSDEIALLPKFKRNPYFGLGPREGFSFARCRLVWPKEDGLWRWRLTRVGDVFKHAQVTDCDFPEPPKFAGGTEPVYVAPPPKPEARYDFRKRLSAPREWRPNGFTGDPIAKDETVLDDYWTLVVESDEPVVKHAAADLRDFLEKRCWARCAGTDGKKRIVVAVAPEKNPLTSRITASENEIRVTGATPREAAQGCYRLEDELTRRDQPAVKCGTRTYTRMFSPRMTHSGYEIEKFPDWHMDQIAHAGMDAILVYVTDPPDMTRNGREDFNALVKRAAEHGLDVYAYLDRWGKPIEKHPLDPGAEEYYDRLFGSVVKNAPGLKGMILVGESCSFPSRDEGVYGYAWEGAGIKPDPAHPKKGCNGFWPASDWKECLELISKVTRKYRPDFDLVFWTYNWARAPEKDRLAMLERIPTNVTLHVTFELGDKPVEKLGVRTMLDDYSISRPGPSETFTGEASVAGRRGIKLSSMTNTGGRTWDFGAIPFEPVPYCWMKRYRALREAKEKYGLKALMDEHHYGFAPNFIADLAKCAFTEETTEADLDACLRSLAERPFGRQNADAVLAAWKDWSDAMEWHAARDFDQYGVLRVGPTYPFAFYGEKISDPPQCLGDEPGHPGGKWIYVWETAGMKWGRIEPHEIAPYLEMNRKELALWQRGNARLAAIKDIPLECRESSRRLIGLGKYCEHTLRSSCNVKRYWLAGLNRSGAEEIRKILDDETENVKGLIPYVEADSQLGWEPSMRYVTDAPCLRWKLQHLQQLLKR